MISVDRKTGNEFIRQVPWEEARYFIQGDNSNDPDAARYRVKVTGNQDSGDIAGLDFFGYFDAKRGKLTNLNLPILTKSGLNRVREYWESEKPLQEPEYQEGIFAYMNAIDDISLRKAIKNLYILVEPTDVIIGSGRHHYPDTSLITNSASIVITQPQLLAPGLFNSVNPGAIQRFSAKLSRTLHLSITPLAISDLRSEAQKAFSRKS